ncbi:MAG: CoA transferase [Chloroflexi bacterium]|nr:CoA transferase [Chloroflexota bacterium]
MNGRIPIGSDALSGIRIIDFGFGAIDPLATSFLADFGAEAIKVESFSTMDFIRRAEYYVDGNRDPDRNPLFSRYNQNKLGVLINLKQPKGVTLAKRLVGIADVVTENFSVDVIHRLGLGYDGLRKIKPDVIMLSASFGGQTGPYRGFRGQGFIMHALEGIDDLTGWPDQPPMSPAVAFGDHYLPWMWAIVILAALEYRRQTGKGQFIDGSSFEGCLDTLDTAIADYSANGRALTRRGNRHPAAAPHGVYRCQGDNRWCAVTVFTDEEWRSLFTMIDRTWARDKRLSTLLRRVEHADELDRLMEEWTSGQQALDLSLRLQQAGIPAAVAETVQDLDEDPQLLHRDHFWKSTERGMEAFTFEAPSARLSSTPARFQRPGPLLGEHNDYVFFDLLGMDPAEYAQLVEEGVIG